MDPFFLLQSHERERRNQIHLTLHFSNSFSHPLPLFKKFFFYFFNFTILYSTFKDLCYYTGSICIDQIRIICLFKGQLIATLCFPGGSDGRVYLQCRRPGFDPWIRKIPRKSPEDQLPTPVFLPREFHGLKSLVGYSRWGHTASDTTEQLTLSLHFQATLILSTSSNPFVR